MTDYQQFTTKDTPHAERRKFHIGDIWSNSIKCLKCGDVIRSKNRHDMVWCQCKSCSVDGGSWYIHLMGDLDNIEMLTEKYNDVIEDEE